MDDMRAVKNLLFRVGSEVANDAKDIAPYRSGNLARDIQVFDENLDKGEIEVGNSKLAPYAPFVHQGTGRQARGKSKAPHKKGQKAQPYLENALKTYISGGGLDRALKDTGENIMNEFKDDLKKNLKNIKVM